MHFDRSARERDDPGRSAASAALAAGAEKSRALALHDAPHGAAAACTVEPGAAVHMGLQLELAGHAMRVSEVAQRGAAQFEGACQGTAHCGCEAVAARAADAVTAGAWVDAGLEQGFAGVDVPGADDDGVQPTHHRERHR